MKGMKIGAWMLFGFLLAGGAFAADSSCIGCHTQDKILQSLFVPPAGGGGEEGEG